MHRVGICVDRRSSEVLACGERHGGHAADHRVGGRLGNGERGADKIATLEREAMAALADGRPAAGHERGAEGDRRRHRQPGGRVERAGPVVLEAEARTVRARRVRPMADDEGTHPLLAIPSHVEERRALGCVQPLVAVPRRVGGAGRIQVDLDHAGRVGGIDEGVDATLTEHADDLANRKDEGGGAGDVVDQDEPGSSRERGVEDGQGVLRPHARKRKRGRDDARAGGRRGGLHRVACGVVLVVEHHDLVAWLESKAPGDDVDGGRGVVDEGEVVGIGAEEPRQLGAGRVQRRLEVAGEERHRLTLHPVAPRLLRREHRPRRRAERPVVEERHRGVEGPVTGELGWHRLGIVRPMWHHGRPSAIIFDLDGTLVDTVPARIDAWEAAFVERGISATRSELGPMIGMDGVRLAREVLTAAGREDADARDVDRRAGELFDERNQSPRPLPGARELLTRLDKAGITWAIATSSRAGQVAGSVAALRLDHQPRIIDGSAVEHAKPAPDLLLIAARELAVEPSTAWYVGDSTWDMRAAVMADMVPIAVLAGAAVDAEALRGAGASVVLDTLLELEPPV